MRRLTIAVAVVGCIGEPVPSEGPYVVPDLTTPEITEFAVWCDADKGEWSLEAIASSWTGGGVSHWTVDGVYVEKHKVNSVAIAENGSRDELLLELNVVSDWREAKNGSSTTFGCGADPSVVFVLDDPEGAEVDCRSWGDDPSIFDSVAGVPSCVVPDGT